MKQVKDSIEGVQDGVHNPRKPAKVRPQHAQYLREGVHATHEDMLMAQLASTCRL